MRNTTVKQVSDDLNEADNLKNDLALQRLLRESHLLDPSSSLTLSGSNRHKAIDLHLRSLGAKASVLVQEKMPMAHRKGILSKTKVREKQRRTEAKENGIILEKANGDKVISSKRREKGIGAPAVGKFKGGMLKLSKQDLVAIRGAQTGQFRDGKVRRR